MLIHVAVDSVLKHNSVESLSIHRVGLKPWKMKYMVHLMNTWLLWETSLCKHWVY